MSEQEEEIPSEQEEEIPSEQEQVRVKALVVETRIELEAYPNGN